MIWNDHSNLVGHAVLSPSTVSWLNYSDENRADSLFAKYKSAYAQTLGTVLHEYAELHIKERIRLKKSGADELIFYARVNGIPRSVIDTDFLFENLMHYVNDAIGFKMDPEVKLMHSYNCWGTADAISFRNNVLRIHDLKTGKTPAHMEQLMAYAALFCLEYKFKPEAIKTELRIYQAGDILECTPEADEIKSIMQTIKVSDSFISEFKEES